MYSFLLYNNIESANIRPVAAKIYTSPSLASLGVCVVNVCVCARMPLAKYASNAFEREHSSRATAHNLLLISNVTKYYKVLLCDQMIIEIF